MCFSIIKPYFFTIISLLIACSPTVGKIATAQTKNIEEIEDLTHYRTNFNKKNDSLIIDEIHSNEELQEYYNRDSLKVLVLNDNQLLINNIEEQIELVKQKKYWNGFAIEVFYGTSRRKANKVKSIVYHYNNELRPKIQFMPPYYRIRVGQFDEKFLAYPLLSELSKIVSRAVIVPIKVEN